MGIRGRGRPGPRLKKTPDPIIAAALPEVVQPEVVQTPAVTEEEQIIAARRAKDAERKRAERLEVRVAKETAEVRKELFALETIHDFWAASQAKASPEKMTKLKDRQEDVEAIRSDIRIVLDGHSPDPEFIDDVDDEIQADVKAYGVVEITAPVRLALYWRDSMPAQLGGRYWHDPALLAQLTSGKETPSTIFAKFGILTALRDDILHEWKQFKFHNWKQFKRTRPAQPPVPSAPETPEYVVLECRLCNKPTTVHASTAAAYAGKYRCPSCSNNDSIRDDWGRDQ